MECSDCGKEKILDHGVPRLLNLRPCSRCGRPVCEECVAYRGQAVPFDSKIVTCGSCDYIAFQNAGGGPW